jgi:amino acid adenylation domain-containing protein
VVRDGDPYLLSPTQPERQQLLVDWNQTNADYPSAACVHELFEAQVERTPANVAVAFQGQELTYQGLNRRANQLAHHLRHLGVGPEVLVGICLEHSLEMVVGLLGILKAGAAFVPLDPTYPKARLGFMLEDSEVLVLLTQRHLLEKLPAHGARQVLLEADWSIGAGQSEANPSPTAKAENLAYVMYTSGSTGQPKGALIVHRGLVNYLFWCLGAYKLEEGTGAPVHSSIAFDLTITALFAPLLAGRTVIVLPPSHGLEALCAALRTQTNLSLVKITPSHLRLLSERIAPADVAGRIRTLIIGGENLMADTLAFWQDFAPETALINEYGPTETVVGSCVYQVPPGKKETGSVPIGRPIANTQAYVLDLQGQPVPVGVTGELYLGGAGLARGYLKRPQLTAERFVPHPFSKDPAARLYKTGDLVRWRPDGNLEFLGRLDNQVKLRGFRIELEEIETALSQHPQVREAVVLLREDRPGNRRLVSYVVPQDPLRAASADLRGFLKEKLPEYMLPVAFVTLDALPLTPNGKVDRRALPAPPGTRPEFVHEYVSPRTPIQQEMVALWAELLGVGRVGVLDNFFALGGDSLLAVRLFARIEKQYHRVLPLAVLFQQGTIAGLAELLADPGAPPTRDVAVVALQQGTSNRRPLFLMPSLGGELLFARLLIHHLGDETAVYGLQPKLAAENKERFVDFKTTAAQQVQAMREFQWRGPYALCGYSYGGILAYEVARQLVALGEQVDLVAVLDAGPRSEGHPAKLQYSGRRAAAHLRNLLHWIVDDALRSSPRDLLRRAQRKLRSFQRRWSREPARTASGMELEDVFDVDMILVQNRELMATIWKAFRAYVPKAYPGRVVLIRARTRPIFDNAEHDLGWAGLAAGGVDVHVVPGHHESILTEPYVRQVAHVLKRALDSRTAD